MKVTLTHDGKSVELDLTAEQMTALGLKEEKKRTGYERVEYGNEFWYADSASRVLENPCGINVFVAERYGSANYYSDYKLAAANARADSLMRQLRRFAAENGGIPSVDGWKKNFRIDKWEIDFDYTEDCLTPQLMRNLRSFGTIFFNTKEACKKAIEKFKDELIWYFTEYEAMLR